MCMTRLSFLVREHETYRAVSCFQGSISNFEKFGKSVDFVLVYSDDSTSHISTKCESPAECDTNIRIIFEGNLADEGLELEKEIVNGLTFVKIHAPRPVLRKNCEVLKLKMPMRQVYTEGYVHQLFRFLRVY